MRRYRYPKLEVWKANRNNRISTAIRLHGFQNLAFDTTERWIRRNNSMKTREVPINLKITNHKKYLKRKDIKRGFVRLNGRGRYFNGGLFVRPVNG